MLSNKDTIYKIHFKQFMTEFRIKFYLSFSVYILIV